MTSKGVIFKRTLYDNRWSVFWWGIGVGLMGLYVVLAYPSMKGLEELSAIIDSPIFQAILGDMSQLNFASPEGFVSIEFLSWMPIVLAVYAVMFGIGVTAGEESRGTIDVLLSTPTPRWQVIVEKFLAYAVAISAILLLGTALILLAVLVTPEIQSASTLLLLGILNMLPTMLFIAAIAICLGTFLRSSSQTGAITAAILTASYFLNSLADMSKNNVMDALRYLSFYKYYAPLTIAAEGINWGYFSLLLLLCALLLGLAIWRFERRDIYV